ncbi:MAG: hypothetical protein EAZ17_09495 [Sphingobacteriales bacterium]|nr:MAG: hypothetical protein EAZ17_09495 [Sphingobacteriales bacterium]
MSAYFIYDGVYGILKKYNDKDMTFHHVVSLIFVAWPLFSGFNGAEVTEAILQAEITNPCINLTEIMPLTSNGFPQLTFFFQITFLITFIIVRVYWSTRSLTLLQLSDSQLSFKFVPTLIWALGMYWVWMMINKAIKLLHEVRLKELIFRRIQKVRDLRRRMQ